SQRPSLEPYLVVLQRYLDGDIDDTEFEFTYTHMFRDDSTLRPGDEVEVLNSIFGDVDRHMNMHLMMASKADNSQLRARAKDAYDRLKGMAQASARSEEHTSELQSRENLVCRR